MQARPRGSHRRRRGGVIVVVLGMIILLAGLAVALVGLSSVELTKACNSSDVDGALLAAESGLAFLQHVAQGVELPSDTTDETLPERLHAQLAGLLAFATVSQPAVTLADGIITIAPIDLPDSSFTCRLDSDDSQTTPACRLTVTGHHGAVCRRVQVLLVCSARPADVFGHGIASRGSVSIQGNASLTGVTEAADASVLSASGEPVTIELGGHASMTGDLYVAGQDASSVSLSGHGLSVAGTSDLDEIIADHLHIVEEAPEFPETDTADLAAHATNVVDANTDLGSGQTFTNIRIAAGTNPTFGSDTVLNGIVYVEAPNIVTFNSSTLNGMIVTADGGAYPIAECQIDFKGRTTAPGVTALPETPEFADLRQLAGTILLAPGFGATFRGSSNLFNGVLAADQLTFRGNLDIAGDLAGVILGLGAYPLTLSGNASIQVSHRDGSVLPVGFKHPLGLGIVPGSYSELAAGD